MNIFIKKFPLFLRVGHFTEEKESPRAVFLDLKLTLATTNKSSLEKLDKTIDYGEVMTFLETEFKQSSVNLLETLAYKVANKLMLRFTLLQEITVTVEKSLMSPHLTKGASISVESHFKKENFQ